MADTLIGLRYKAYSNERNTFTLRTAGLAAGSYPLTNLGPFAPGLKASGALFSGLYGATLPKNFFFSAELGYTTYQKPVADNVFGNAVIGRTFGRWNSYVGYQQSRGLSGLDIGGPGFLQIGLIKPNASTAASTRAEGTPPAEEYSWALPGATIFMDET